jgi:hypothetical protein
VQKKKGFPMINKPGQPIDRKRGTAPLLTNQIIHSQLPRRGVFRLLSSTPRRTELCTVELCTRGGSIVPTPTPYLRNYVLRRTNLAPLPLVVARIVAAVRQGATGSESGRRLSRAASGVLTVTERSAFCIALPQLYDWSLSKGLSGSGHPSAWLTQ